jgi:protein-S-isoprenylcysteine O-methyltransferase Ste14
VDCRFLFTSFGGCNKQYANTIFNVEQVTFFHRANWIAFAIQVYWAKFKRKGMVNNFVYSYIRHPQYLFFMLSGVGLLFIWPRMMMLILFTIMSIFYFYLAKFEESRMQAKHPEYLEYLVEQ